MENFIWFRTAVDGAVLTFQDRNGRRVRTFPDRGSAETFAAKFGMLSMIAYGEEADFVDPPRPADPKIPWNINWTTKVRYKSTTGLMLGMPAMGGMGMGAAAEEQAPAATDTQSSPAAPPKKKKGGLFGTLQDLSGAIPH